MLLLTPTQIRNFEDIPQSVEDTRLEVRIQQMQDLDLKPFLGLAFYSDFMLNSTEQKYLDLLNGVDSYTDLRGNTIVFSGLKTALIYFTIARFLNSDKIRYTATGPVIKNDTFSQNLKDDEKSVRMGELLSMGNAYMNDVDYYLRNNRDTYPLYRENRRNRELRQPFARIRAIDKGDFYNKLYKEDYDVR